MDDISIILPALLSKWTLEMSMLFVNPPHVSLLIPLYPPVVSGRRGVQPHITWMERSPWGTWPLSEPPIWGQDICSGGVQLAGKAKDELTPEELGYKGQRRTALPGT